MARGRTGREVESASAVGTSSSVRDAGSTASGDRPSLGPARATPMEPPAATREASLNTVKAFRPRTTATLPIIPMRTNLVGGRRRRVAGVVSQVTSPFPSSQHPPPPTPNPPGGHSKTRTTPPCAERYSSSLQASRVENGSCAGERCPEGRTMARSAPAASAARWTARPGPGGGGLVTKGKGVCVHTNAKQVQALACTGGHPSLPQQFSFASPTHAGSKSPGTHRCLQPASRR
jgi:hypothetical protein